MKPNRTFWRHLGVIALYLLIALVTTYPLILHFGDHLIGSPTWALDEFFQAWNNWWFKFAVFDQGVSPFYSDWLFYPQGTNMILYAYTLLHVILLQPLYFAFGLVPAQNALVLFSFVVSAYGMYLFTSYLLRVSFRIWQTQGYPPAPRDPAPRWIGLAAFLAGIVWTFSSNRWVYAALGHYNILAIEFIPFYMLFLVKTLLRPDWKFPILAGLFAALAMYAELSNGVLLVLLTAVVLVFEWRLLKQSASAFLRLLVLAGCAALFFAPLLLPTLNEIFNSGYKLPGWGHSEKLLVDLFGFFTPISLHPLNRHWEQELDLVRQGISRFSDINTFFVGYLTVALAILGAALYWRKVRMWAAIAILFSILALGPLLHINGVSEFDLDGITTTVPLPFFILHYIPLLKENRVPNRFSILVLFALAVLVAYAAYWLMDWLAKRQPARANLLATGLCGLLAVALLFEHIPTPIALSDARIPEIYSQIGADQENFTVLSLPVGWRNSFGTIGAEDTRTQFYQTASQKYLLTGQLERNPPFLFEYFARAPILRSLIALETYNPVDEATLTQDRALAQQFVNFFDIRYLVVNSAIPNRPPWSDTRDVVTEYVKQVLPLGEQVYDRDGTLAFRVKQTPLLIPYQVKFNDELGMLYQGAGWLPTERIADADANWATAPRATLYLPLRELRDYTLTLRALPFVYPDSPPQSFGVTLNGQTLERVTLNPGWNEYQIKLPAAAVKSGLNQVDLDFNYVARPRDVLPAHFEIGGTGVTSPVDIVATSTAEFGSLKINDKEVSPLKRGYNLAVIDPQSGNVLEVKNFDTGGKSILESRALREFINQIPDGMIVAGAVQEDATAMLGEAAAAAIQALGLQTNLRGHDGYTHAFIAVKGKPNGLEQTGEGASAVSVGHALDNRPLSAALDWFRVE
ncbi:hypothetical protein FBQ82_10285 [Anaerolineae bacterium CFX7]|nr:hypothetical protein [Anaerolineae bacterium CFX7]